VSNAELDEGPRVVVKLLLETDALNDEVGPGLMMLEVDGEEIDVETAVATVKPDMLLR